MDSCSSLLAFIIKQEVQYTGGIIMNKTKRTILTDIGSVMD